jgi:hypothetical protein
MEIRNAADFRAVARFIASSELSGLVSVQARQFPRCRSRRFLPLHKILRSGLLLVCTDLDNRNKTHVTCSTTSFRPLPGGSADRTRSPVAHSSAQSPVPHLSSRPGRRARDASHVVSGDLQVRQVRRRVGTGSGPPGLTPQVSRNLTPPPDGAYPATLSTTGPTSFSTGLRVFRYR